MQTLIWDRKSDASLRCNFEVEVVMRLKWNMRHSNDFLKHPSLSLNFLVAD